ncbi:tachylectin-related carbohydrate-binding protein [Kribbella sp. NPDC049174]|uniref:tachylectin-related carbohydrate-binding protein n=1 Tax=Kribbella sp. NPDC049174 TaxID=3364112 RepID=UPI00371A4651
MRKSILAAAAALAVAATGLVVVARPTAAALSDVPADCSVSTAAYRSDGQRLTYVYSGQTTSTKAYANDNLGWVPTAHQQIGASGDDTSFRSTEYAARAGEDRLYKLSRQGELVDGTWRITAMSASHIGVGFAGTRILASASPYLYHVAGSSLYRSTETYVDGVFTLSRPVKLAGTGWDTVNTLTYERSGGTGSAAVDVLIGTKSNGELKEWRINRATPTTITSKVLRASGWGPFTSLSTGYCDAHPNGRPLLGITAAGRASVHFDANKTDSIGTDIKGGSLGSLGWTAKAYGQ